MELSMSDWDHPTWRELNWDFSKLYRHRNFYKHVEDILRQKAYDCNRRSCNGIITWLELKQLYEKQNGLCFWEARWGFEIDLRLDFEPDHFIPLDLGGANTIDNIVLSTRDMNRRKSNKHPVNFLIELGDYEMRFILKLARHNHDLILLAIKNERQRTLDSLSKKKHLWKG